MFGVLVDQTQRTIIEERPADDHFLLKGFYPVIVGNKNVNKGYFIFSSPSGFIELFWTRVTHLLLSS